MTGSLLLRNSWRQARPLTLLLFALMAALAASLVVALSSTHRDVARSVQEAYDRLALLDFLLEVEAPPAVLDDLRMLPGVAAVEGRRWLPVRLLLGEASVAGELVGVPPTPSLTVNRLHLVTGHWPSGGREALVESRFARAHGLTVGQRVRVAWEGQETWLTVAGWVDSAEFIWLTTSRFDPRPALDRRGILFVAEADLAALRGDRNLQEVAVRVTDPRRRDAVMAEADRRLRRYRLPKPPIPREELASVALVARDLRVVRILATAFPLPLLTLLLSLLGLQLARQLRARRRELGVLLSLGARPSQVMLQVAGPGLAATLLGALVGLAGGASLAPLLTQAYVRALGAPFVAARPHPELWLTTLALVALFAAAVCWGAVAPLLRERPVALLRADFRAVPLPALPSAWPLGVRLAVRNAWRHPWRTLATLLGMTFACALFVTVGSLWTNQERVLEHQVRQVHRYDFDVDLRDPTSASVLPAFAAWEGVAAVEPVLRLGGLMEGARTVPMGLWGLAAGQRLLRLVDQRGRPLELPDEPTLVLGPVQLERLGVRPGQTVVLLANGDPRLKGPWQIGPQADEALPNPAKASLQAVRRFAAAQLGLPADAVSKLLVKALPGWHERLRLRLEAHPLVEDVVSIRDTEAQVRAYLGPIRLLELLMAVLAGLVSSLLLVGTTALNVAERSFEWRQLSALGAAPERLFGWLLVELGLSWLAGVAVGLPLGQGLASWLVNRFQPELLSVRMLLELPVALGAAGATAALALLAAALTARRASA